MREGAVHPFSASQEYGFWASQHGPIGPPADCWECKVAIRTNRT